jgi:hypothetical protein
MMITYLQFEAIKIVTLLGFSQTQYNSTQTELQCTIGL